VQGHSKTPARPSATIARTQNWLVRSLAT
jgi:hypothetical protein